MSSAKAPAPFDNSHKRQKVTATESLSQTKPIRSLVPPGVCQFTEDFTSVPLLERTPISSTSTVLKFGLPDREKPLNLSTCACILAKADISYNVDGNDKTETLIRPYTPISTNAMVGSFDLLVKDYGRGMSNHLCETMKVGDTVDFKHIPFNVKIQAPFPKKHIVMIAGGTGITPMIQALHAILGKNEETSQSEETKDIVEKVTLLYGSRVANDVLGKELLDEWAKQFSNKFKVVHVLSEETKSEEEKKDDAVEFEYGYIDRNLIERHIAHTSQDDLMVFVCGPPPMYDALCGPRDKPEELTGALADIGLLADQVYKF